MKVCSWCSDCDQIIFNEFCNNPVFNKLAITNFAPNFLKISCHFPDFVIILVIACHYLLINLLKKIIGKFEFSNFRNWKNGVNCFQFFFLNWEEWKILGINSQISIHKFVFLNSINKFCKVEILFKLKFQFFDFVKNLFKFKIPFSTFFKWQIFLQKNQQKLKNGKKFFSLGFRSKLQKFIRSRQEFVRSCRVPL